MKRMYAPWRNDYVTKKVGTKKPPSSGCIFCEQFSQRTDKKNLIVKRFKYNSIVLNRYPYNSGHVMILPFAHKANLEDLEVVERMELMEVITATKLALDKAMKPEGFNIGVNLGIAGGGGIPSHLHVHIVPRWQGDTNFLATLGETTLICSDFHQIYDSLEKECAKIKLPEY